MSNNKEAQKTTASTPDELEVARALLDATDDLVFSLSLHPFRVTWANTAATRYLLQSGRPKPIGKTLSDLAYDAERAEFFESLLREAQASGLAETDFQSALDSKLWRLRVEAVHRNGECIGLVANFKDVTPQVLALKRASESESMYGSLFKCMGVGAVFQAANGRIVAANRAAESILGRSEAQMMGLDSDSSDWDAVKHDGSPFPGQEHPSMVTLRNGQPQSNVVMGIRRPNGDRRWLSINAEPVISEDSNRPTAVVTTFNDITEQRELQSELDASLVLLRKLTERVPGVLYQFVLSPDGKASLPYVSDHAWSLFEIRPEDVRSDAQPFFNQVHTEDLPGLMASIQRSANELSVWRHEFRVVLPSNGRVVWMGGEAQPEKTADGGILWHGITRDISELKAHEAHLFRLGHLDESTGLPNRRYLSETLELTIREVATKGGIGVFIQVDLDEFSQVNDAYGHMAGDAILTTLAKRLSGALAGAGFLARMGGDEFAVLYRCECQTHEESRQDALSMVERICALVSQPIQLDHTVYTPRCSAGVSLFSSTEASAADVMREADTALYRAKRSGRGRSVVFEDQMLADTRYKLELSQDLANAMARGQIEVYIQPQFDMNRNLAGGELLVRWNHPRHGYISPVEFIPLAEESGVIHLIGDFVLRQACSLLQRLPAGVTLKLSVNVSPAEFMATDYIDRVSAILSEYKVDPRMLTLEVTESLLIQDTEAGKEKMTQLSQLGLSFSIDDFGTGYSSLAYLKTLPIAELKIDQSFVGGIPVDGSDVAIVQAVLSMAKFLSLKIVAEGVENEDQFGFLVNHGCDLVQGYLLAQPEPIDIWLSRLIT